MKKESCVMDTYSGKKVNPFDMEINDIDIEDIAQALSQLCRFNGHTNFFYSVAQHSYYVARFLEHKGFEKEIILAGLLHDAAEAYFGDLIRPLKESYPEFEADEKRLQSVIYRRFGVPENEYTMGPVKVTDELLLCSEQFVLITDGIAWPTGVGAPMPMQIHCWTVGQAKNYFLEMFHKLWNAHELSRV